MTNTRGPISIDSSIPAPPIMADEAVGRPRPVRARRRAGTQCAARVGIALVGPLLAGPLLIGLALVGLPGCASDGANASSSPKPITQPEGMALVATAAPPLPPMAQPVSDAQLAREFNNLHSNGAMYFAGWPTEAGMRALAARGVRRIIALKTPDETLAARGYDPRALAKQLGITLVEMPVNAETLSNAYIDAFAREVDRDGGPTLMYCGSASTCGMVWGSYLARAKGASTTEALAQARAAGLKDGPLADAAQRYIAGTAKDSGSK